MLPERRVLSAVDWTPADVQKTPDREDLAVNQSISQSIFVYYGMTKCRPTVHADLQVRSEIEVIAADCVGWWNRLRSGVAVARLNSIPGAEHLSRHVTSHPGQLSLAIPSWVGAKSTSQRAVTPCGWGIKAGMVRVWVAGKTVWFCCYIRIISERFRDKGLIIKRCINSSVYFYFCYLLAIFPPGTGGT